MDDAEEQSLDLVQRLIISALMVVVLGAPAVALAAYGVHIAAVRRPSAIGMIVLAGVIGLLTAIGVHLVNRRRPYAPTVLLGLIPAAVAAYLIF